MFPLQIYTALKLRCGFSTVLSSLFPLRIYTALKRHVASDFSRACLFPLRIYTALKHPHNASAFLSVCFPYEFTLLSNRGAVVLDLFQFVSPTNLHCSQTQADYLFYSLSFVSPTNLHCSQTHHVVFPRFL